MAYHVKAVLFAQLVEENVVGVVAEAHGIEVVALEQQDVLHHDLLALHFPAPGVVLVAVDALRVQCVVQPVITFSGQNLQWSSHR